MIRSIFYDNVRTLFDTRLSTTQVEGFEAILNATESLPIQWQAYILATAWHETAKTMQPVQEWKQGLNKKYGITDPETGKKYFGRGHVQLTWRHNYQKAGDELGIDLVHKPELALVMTNSVRIMVDGMIQGWFTGKKLSNYLNDERTDYINARRIINGNDRAATIAQYARFFEQSLLAAA